MISKKKWLCIVSGLIVVFSAMVTIYSVFIFDWSDSGNVKKREDSSSIISVDTSQDIPRSKTGVVLVFELNEILLDVDTKKVVQQIGFSQLMAFARSKNVNFMCVGQELSRVVSVVLHKASGGGADYDQIPAIIRDWQLGKKNGLQLKEIILEKIEENPEWFASKLEKEVVSLIISNMFTPESFVSTIKLVRSGFEALVRYKKKGHTLIAFFNSDPATYAVLKATFPELFALFDGIRVSCDTHQIKPDREAYTFFINRKKEYGETIFMIEAANNNYEAALSYGLETYGLKNILITKKSDFLGLNSYPDFTALNKKIN